MCERWKKALNMGCIFFLLFFQIVFTFAKYIHYSLQTFFCMMMKQFRFPDILSRKRNHFFLYSRFKKIEIDYNNKIQNNRNSVNDNLKSMMMMMMENNTGNIYTIWICWISDSCEKWIVFFFLYECQEMAIFNNMMYNLMTIWFDFVDHFRSVFNSFCMFVRVCTVLAIFNSYVNVLIFLI